jgi:hypothetical protein
MISQSSDSSSGVTDDILEMMQILLQRNANLPNQYRNTMQRTSSWAQKCPWFQMHVVLHAWESSFIMIQNELLLTCTETDHVKALPSYPYSSYKREMHLTAHARTVTFHLGTRAVRKAINRITLAPRALSVGCRWGSNCHEISAMLLRKFSTMLT